MKKKTTCVQKFFKIITESNNKSWWKLERKLYWMVMAYKPWSYTAKAVFRQKLLALSTIKI
jgi:hypothetical protein